MNYRTILFSVALVGFGILVIATTLFYASTNGFTAPVQFYETTTYTVEFGQGIQAVAVGSSTSTTLTSENLGTVSLFITDVIFIPTRNSSLNLLYLLGFVLIVLAIGFPLYALSKSSTPQLERRPSASSVKDQVYCGHCGSKLPPGSMCCNKCASAVGE
jgi:hypothetical protein